MNPEEEKKRRRFWVNGYNIYGSNLGSCKWNFRSLLILKKKYLYFGSWIEDKIADRKDE